MIKKMFFIFLPSILFSISIANATSEVTSNPQAQVQPNNEMQEQMRSQPQQQRPIQRDSTQPRKYKSIMFSDKNVDDIFKILPIFKLSKEADILSKDQAGISDSIGIDGIGSRPVVNQSNIMLYLDSIMYISKNFWSVWLNGNKITNLNNGDSEIVVVDISPLKASFVWTMGLSVWNVINAKGQIPESRYKINGNQVSLYFSLSPNQTYLPAVDKVIEGRVIQKSLEDSTDTSSESSNRSRSELYF